MTTPGTWSCWSLAGTELSKKPPRSAGVADEHEAGANRAATAGDAAAAGDAAGAGAAKEGVGTSPMAATETAAAMSERCERMEEASRPDPPRHIAARSVPRSD